ncbi:unnamed protein product [Phaedon cochleariae]|uniref:ESF1-like protein n=1 Tax=Phaedon cochleariae TaxID=80249 RepID=A0A9P0GSR3_PHACE|nr:unnamed protein product [Phaedon cochleariae]
MEDSRFSHVKIDPKFRRISKKERKVKIDKRFQSMFNDKKFKVKYTTDIRGRPVNQTSNEDLKRYYELSSDSDREFPDGRKSDSEEQEHKGERKFLKSPKENKVISELKIKNKSDGVVVDATKKKLQNLDIDYARGESTLLSESSSDDEGSIEDISETEEVDHKWGELDNDAELTDEVTSRLAACNMDWDRIRAMDLMVLFNSFLPSGSVIKSVAIYPSEFGKARMKEEELKGPTELVETKTDNNDDNENEDGSNYHMEKLRQYQLNRLKYYYAVISFDNAISANKIYTECDGMEYESSSIKIDLRFIPDDMQFDDEPKEICDKLPEVNKYQPRFFTTTALQQAKVDLTWDETNPDRIELTQKLSSGKIDNISKADLQNYLASSSGSEESESDVENAPTEGSDGENGIGTIDKYKALLQEIEDDEKSKKNKDVEMEISWGIDLKEKTEKLVKDKMNHTEQKTPFQKYLDKRKEKRKEKRSQRKGQNKDDSDSDIPSDIDMSDPYFADEFNSSEFKKPSKKSKQKVKDFEEGMDEQKHAELELLLMNEDSSQKHFSLKKIQDSEKESKNKKSKNKKKAADDEIIDNDFQVNVQDERFSALFTSHHYNIDPTNPHYKKTKAMETLEKEKLKRRTDGEVDKAVEINQKKIKRNVELSLLVKSVKRKTNEYLNK